MAIRAATGLGRLWRFIFLVIGIAILAYVIFYKDETVSLTKNFLRSNSSLNSNNNLKHHKGNSDEAFLHDTTSIEYVYQRVISYSKSLYGNIWIPDNYTGTPCNYTLDLPQDKIMEKISSYKFPGVQQYITDLFPETSNQTPPYEPVFVSAVSSNHLREGLAFVLNFKKMACNDKKRTLIIYDIGLTLAENKKLAEFCDCEVPIFPFDDYPDHIGILDGYAWKPVVIQLVARKHPFVVWLDSSSRFKNTNVESLVEKGRKRGVVCLASSWSLVYQTSIELFRFLNEPPCLYFGEREAEGGLVVIYMTPFIKKYFMVPWVSCALVRECMVTTGHVRKIWDCVATKEKNFHCHRFDQSVLGVLMKRLFHKNILDHRVRSGEYNYLCRNCF